MRNATSPTFDKRPAPAAGRAVLAWIVFLTAFFLLTLAAALRADGGERYTATATRTDDFVATGAIKSLAVESINGDVQISSGASFSAKVDITVRARSEEKAKRILKEIRSSFENENGELTLLALPPGADVTRHGRSWHVHSDREEGFDMSARVTVTIPPAAALEISVVNGNVVTRGIAGEQELSSVNGKIDVTGGKSDMKLNTVNGNIVGSLSELSGRAEVKAETVNGNIALTLPANASFRFSGHTMSGDIVSSFPLPVAEDGEARDLRREQDRIVREKARIEREKARAKAQKEREKAREKSRKKAHDEDGDSIDVDIDMSELNESLAELNRELAEMSSEIAHSVTMNLNRTYEGSVGSGGASIRCSNLNGKISILAAGAPEDKIRSIVSSKRPFTVTVPRMAVAPMAPMAPMAPVAPMAPRAPRAPKASKAPKAWVPDVPEPDTDNEGESIVRGDIVGDFQSNIPVGDITLGKVTGHVKVVTNSGQIKVAEAGKGAELFSSGGDIKVDSVTGDLKCTTYGGDLRVGNVSGAARLETSGGDIVVRGAGGTITAKTGGGDVRLSKVKGALRAETAGGSVVCEVVGKESVEISTNGGDVTLTLPESFKGDVEIRVSGVDADGDYIVSQFPELTISKRSGMQRAEGRLNGGGARVTVRSNSGTVTLRKGPAA